MALPLIFGILITTNLIPLDVPTLKLPPLLRLPPRMARPFQSSHRHRRPWSRLDVMVALNGLDTVKSTILQPRRCALPTFPPPRRLLTRLHPLGVDFPPPPVARRIADRQQPEQRLWPKQMRQVAPPAQIERVGQLLRLFVVEVFVVPVALALLLDGRERPSQSLLGRRVCGAAG